MVFCLLRATPGGTEFQGKRATGAVFSFLRNPDGRRHRDAAANLFEFHEILPVFTNGLAVGILSVAWESPNR